ncbi:type VI secretion system lipoprotein TssJ [Cronobacter malonaticus]
MAGWKLLVRAAGLRHYRLSARQVCLFIALSLTVACRSAPPEESANTIELKLIAGPNMNLNSRGVASPLKVSIYALTNDEAFLDAGYLTITESPDPELKNQMRQIWEGILRPGEKKHVTVLTDKTTHTLGTVAAYREIQKAQWSEAYRLPEKQPAAWYQKLWPWHTEAPPQTVEMTFDKLHITIKGLNSENE